jgi:tRNA pseudouridine55 synthase
VELPEIGFRVTCSSGTYVRALARDLGDAWGVGAHLTGLRRTAIGRWSVDDALAVASLTDASRVAAHAVPPLEALRHLPRVDVDDGVAGRLVLGQAVRLEEHPPSGAPLAVANRGELLAIGEADDGVLRPRKVFAA